MPFSVVLSMRAIAGATDLAMAMMPCPDELARLSSATGRTATRSTPGFPTTSLDRRPATATTPSERAEPIKPATTATAHSLVPDASASSPRSGERRADGRSELGRMAPQPVVGRQRRAADGRVIVVAVVEGHEDQR